MDTRGLSERDICTKFITPALERAGWDVHTQLREEVNLTAGRIIVRGKLVTRGKNKRADYVLYWKPGIPLAVVEAKDNTHSTSAGIQQALEYAEMLNVPFAVSSNGDGFVLHDRSGHAAKMETSLALDEFPSPDELWLRYRRWKGLDAIEAPALTQDYYSDGGDKSPRYYQMNAINRVIEAVASGQQRLLLVMATGTGKTYTAFQIIWRLWKSGTKKRILFLADRNILVDQTRTNDFKPFGGSMTKITNSKADPSFEIYLAIYQAITGSEVKEDLFRQFSPSFFDLIIVDECHRGSARDDSAWRDVLTYFSAATQLGLTATPKETTAISTSHYFGEPVYTYSLRQGIDDGYLAPYKVVRVDLDKDLTGWRPEVGKTDKFGEEIADRVYNQRDFDRNIVLEKRTELVAKKVTQFLRETNPMDKTIVFCEDINHAARMRQELINANPEQCAKNQKYVMQITGDNEEGKAELDNFIMPESLYPVIVTTSKLMTTGVDAKTCKVIVLDQTIKSMTEFKQIIGRGTRVEEDYGKLYFTIIDFRKATELFADPDFDGDPVVVYQPPPGEPIAPPDEVRDADGNLITDPAQIAEVLAARQASAAAAAAAQAGASNQGGDSGELNRDNPARRVRYVINDVEVSIAAERVQYYGNDGRLITESLRDYSKKTIRKRYASLDSFLKTWTASDRKQAIIDELREQGVFFDEIADQVGKDYAPFDLVCHVAFDQPPLTRRERANNVRKRNYFTKYGDAARAVLEALLTKFANENMDELDNMAVLKINPLAAMGTPVELVKRFGSKANYLEAIAELQLQLFTA